MWESTRKIAYAIQSGFNEKSYETRMFDLKTSHISDVMADVINSEYICVGSSTLNNNLLPSVAAFLTYLKGLAPKDRKALAFGSYGWSGQSVDQVERILNEIGCLVVDKYRLQYVPGKEDLANITEKIKTFL
jgi:flavorubredoxin